MDLDQSRRAAFRYLLLMTSSVTLSVASAGLTSGARAQVVGETGERLTRQQWLGEIQASRHRIDRMRREGRSLEPSPPTDEEVAREASQRALEDDSLRYGDIVSTDRGLMVFKGRSLGTPSPDDFVPLTPGAVKP